MNKIYLKDLLKMSIPIILGQIGIVAIGLGDVLVASIHSAESLASIGIAVSVMNPFFLMGIGVIVGIAPFLSNAIGRGESIEKQLLNCLGASLVVSLIVMLLTLIVNQIVPLIGIESSLIPFVTKYIDIVVWSVPFAMIFQAAKEFLQAKDQVFFANSIAVLAALFNILLNYALVFGIDDVQGMGYIGLAYASLLIRALMALAILLSLIRYFSLSCSSWSYVRRILKFGYPVGITFLAEVSGFCLFGVLSGFFGVDQAAANNLVLNISSLTFMVPLSIASAVSVKVGRGYGAKNYNIILEYSQLALMLGVGFMIVSGLSYVLFGSFVLSMMSNNVEVIRIGSEVLILVALFQVVDGAQVVLSGILRGIEKTAENLKAILVGFWLIGIPIGSLMAFRLDMHIYGLWSGLTLALFVVSIYLSFITLKNLKRLKYEFR